MGVVFSSIVRQFRLWKFIVLFSSAVVSKFMWVLISRWIYSKEERKRNTWNLYLDLMVSVGKTAIENAPPSVSLVKRYVGEAISTPPQVDGSVVAITPITVPYPALLNGVPFPLPLDSSGAAPRALQAEWVVRQGRNITEQSPVILYLHGGAYCFGSAAGWRRQTVHLSGVCGARVLALDYRLAPEYPCPAGILDVVVTFLHLIHPQGCGVARERVVFAGDSAGGGLTVASMLYLRDHGLPLPAGGATLSGWFDLECTGEGWLQDARTPDYLPSRDHVLLKDCALSYASTPERFRDPYVSPMHADLRGLPPLLIQVGAAERLYEDAKRFAERCRTAGVVVVYEEFAGQIHVFQAFTNLAPEARRAVFSIAVFVDRVVPRSSAAFASASAASAGPAKGTSSSLARAGNDAVQSSYGFAASTLERLQETETPSNPMLAFEQELARLEHIEKNDKLSAMPSAETTVSLSPVAVPQIGLLVTPRGRL